MHSFVPRSAKYRRHHKQNRKKKSPGEDGDEPFERKGRSVFFQGDERSTALGRKSTRIMTNSACSSTNCFSFAGAEVHYPEVNSFGSRMCALEIVYKGEFLKSGGRHKHATQQPNALTAESRKNIKYRDNTTTKIIARGTIHPHILFYSCWKCVYPPISTPPPVRSS